jgi:hypothetical protein
VLEIVPQENLAEFFLGLVCYVISKKGYQLWGACSWVWTMLNRCLDDVPRPVGAAVHRDAMAPLPQGGREKVNLCQGWGCINNVCSPCGISFGFSRGCSDGTISGVAFCLAF